MNKHRLKMGKDTPIKKNVEPTLSEYTDFAKKYYGSLDNVFNTEPDEVSYGSICSCNPMNGGSGICGCINGNKMVPNPKKNVRVTETITGNNTIFTNFINDVDKYDELFNEEPDEGDLNMFDKYPIEYVKFPDIPKIITKLLKTNQLEYLLN